MNKINFVILIDKSGSMSSIKKATCDGVNNVLKTINSEYKRVNSTLTLSFFNDNLKKICKLDDPLKYESISDIYNADGGTNICDSILKTLDDIGSPKGRTCFILFTDGQDESTLQEEVKKEINKKDNLYTFVYIGPSGIEVSAKSMGFKNWTSYETTSDGTRDVFSKISFAIKNYINRVCNNISEDLTSDFFLDVENKTVMKVNGISCVINTPDAIKSDKDKVNSLPPYSPSLVYVVDEYPGCPSNWMHGSSKASSYFMSVNDKKGMWIDLNPALKDSEYHIAAVVSVQGINPITGQKVSKLNLEQYKTKCPIHNEEFQQDRFCKSCGFKWPSQNYIASNTTPDGRFWIDGFRSEDGKVRQYVFTEDEVKGVASNIIGNDRVYAIGIAFYKSKTKKPKKQDNILRSSPSNFFSPMYTPNSWKVGAMGMRFGSSVRSYSSSSSKCYAAGPSPCSAASVSASLAYDSDGLECTVDSCVSDESDEKSLIETKSYEVGVGAVIEQKIHIDDQSIDFWEEEPIGLIYVNYCDEKIVENIIKSGKREEKKDGFLNNIPVCL